MQGKATPKLNDSPRHVKDRQQEKLIKELRKTVFKGLPQRLVSNLQQSPNSTYRYVVSHGDFEGTMEDTVSERDYATSRQLLESLSLEQQQHASNPFRRSIFKGGSGLPELKTQAKVRQDREQHRLLEQSMKKDWADVLKEEIKKGEGGAESKAETDRKINFSRFMKSPIAQSGSKLQLNPSLMSGRYGTTTLDTDSQSHQQARFVSNTSIQQVSLGMLQPIQEHGRKSQLYAEESTSQIGGSSLLKNYPGLRSDIYDELQMDQIGKIIKKKLQTQKPSLRHSVDFTKSHSKRMLDRTPLSNRESFAGSVRQMLDREQSKMLGGLQGNQIFPSLGKQYHSPVIARSSLGKPLNQLHTIGFSKPSELLQISSLKRPEYLGKAAVPPKIQSPKIPSPKQALDLEELDRALDSDIVEHLERAEDFTQSLEVQTKLFEERLDDIVENDTYLEGFRNVEVKRNKNPNSLNMYAKDFEMKMAKIEDSLEKHMNSVGEQILMEDENKQDEYEKSKKYHPLQGIGLGVKVPKTLKRLKSLRAGGKSTSTYSEINDINMDIMREKSHHRAGLLPKIQPIKPKLDAAQQVKQDTFLTALTRKDFINREEVTHPILDEMSSINEQNFQFSSIRSQQGDEYGDIMNLKTNFMSNLQVMQRHTNGNVKNRQDLSRLVEGMVEQLVKDNEVIKEEAIEEEPVSPTRRGKGSGEIEKQPRDPTEALDYHRKHMHQTFNRVATDIKDHLQFAQLGKNSNFPELIDRLQDDPKFKYFKVSESTHATVLPILQKIRNRQLTLQGYVVPSGLAKALGACFKKGDTLLNRLILDNNSLSDADFSHILEGLDRLHDIKAIVYNNNNEFGVASALALGPLIKGKMMPYHLEELRLVNCKISQKALNLVLDALLERNFVKKLSLVNVQLNSDACMGKVCQLVNSSRYLFELDISWNGLRPHHVMMLLETLAENRLLQYVNLSWNNLMDTPLKKKGKPNESEEQIQHSIEQTDKKENQDDMHTHAIAKITRFIKYNKCLLHCDLSNTGLSEHAMRAIGASLKRGRSILALHLSGNPGINQDLKDYLFQRIRCIKPQTVMFDSQFETKGTFDKIVRSSLEGHEPVTNFVKDGVELTHIFRQKRQIQQSVAGRGAQDIANGGSTLIFQRWVGHREEMPGSGQWQMLTEKHDHCWVCEKQIYSLILWSKSVGFSQSIDIDFEDRDRIVEQLDLINHDNPAYEKAPSVPPRTPDTGLSINQQPLLCGSFTNWRYKKMFTLDSFLRILDKTDSRAFIKQMRERGRVRSDAKNEEDLNQYEREKYVRFVKNYHIKQKKNWKLSLVRSLKYNKRPFMVNAQYIPQAQPNFSLKGQNDYSSEESDIDDEVTLKESTRHEEVWILPVFIPAGKHSYFVRAEGGEHFAHKLLSPFREEDIPILTKASKFKSVERKFKKENSVFRDWREDVNWVIAKCCELDSKEWKASRFIKDPAEVEKCWKVIEKNFVKLKDMFITLACKSNFPTVTLMDFSIFSEICKFLDSHVVLATIDRLFIAANVEIIANDENPDKELCRFEFFEILLRIAQAKYRETNLVATPSEALEKLLKENVFANYKTHPWQEFRDKELWTVDVNDVFEANLESIRKVYTTFFDPRKKYMTLNEALDLFMKMTPIQLTEKDAIFCHGMAKMTCVNEAEESSAKYKRLQFVELLEMIGRVAEVKFRATEMEHQLSLAQKIEFVLDELFVPFELKRRDVKIIVDEQSESDDDY